MSRALIPRGISTGSARQQEYGVREGESTTRAGARHIRPHLPSHAVTVSTVQVRRCRTRTSLIVPCLSPHAVRPFGRADWSIDRQMSCCRSNSPRGAQSLGCGRRPTKFEPPIPVPEGIPSGPPTDSAISMRPFSVFGWTTRPQRAAFVERSAQRVSFEIVSGGRQAARFDAFSPRRAIERVNIASLFVDTRYAKHRGDSLRDTPRRSRAETTNLNIFISLTNMTYIIKYYDTMGYIHERQHRRKSFSMDPTFIIFDASHSGEAGYGNRRLVRDRAGNWAGRTSGTRLCVANGPQYGSCGEQLWQGGPHSPKKTRGPISTL